MKMKHGSHRYDINRPMSRHGHKYSNYETCLAMMTLICIKQHLSNIWISIHEKKATQAELKKSFAFGKKRVLGM